MVACFCLCFHSIVLLNGYEECWHNPLPLLPPFPPPPNCMSKERLVKDRKCFIQFLQMVLEQSGLINGDLNKFMIFLHYSVFHHPNRVMMLIMMLIFYTSDCFQKQRKLKQLAFTGTVVFLRKPETAHGYSEHFENSNMMAHSGTKQECPQNYFPMLWKVIEVINYINCNIHWQEFRLILVMEPCYKSLGIS